MASFLKGAAAVIGKLTGMLPGAPHANSDAAVVPSAAGSAKDLNASPHLVIPDEQGMKKRQEDFFERFLRLRAQFEEEAKGKPFEIEKELFTESVPVPRTDRFGNPISTLLDGVLVPQTVMRSEVPSDLKKLYKESPFLKGEMEKLAETWSLLGCTTTAMSEFFRRKTPAKTDYGIVAALKAWKGREEDVPAAQFIDFVLGPDHYHHINEYLGSEVVKVNDEAFLMKYLQASGHYGNVNFLIVHGNQAKDSPDLDVMAEMNRPCIHLYPTDKMALEALAEGKELDIIMYTKEGNTVGWSTVNRLLTSYLRWLHGAGPALSYRQLNVLRTFRVEGIFQRAGRTSSYPSVAKFLIHCNKEKREEANTHAKAILEKTNLGGLTSEELHVVLLAMADELKNDVSPTPRPPAKGKPVKKEGETDEIRSRRQSVSKVLLQLLKAIAHVRALDSGMYSPNTCELVEAALSGCSEETMRVVRQLLKHKVPINPEGKVDEEGIASVVALLCREIETLPLPEPAPAVPDVAAAPLVVKANSRIEALFADQRAANAAAAAAALAAEATMDAKATLASQAEYLLMIKTIRNAALIRAEELAGKQVELIQQRISTAETKLKNAEGRPEPKLKQGEDEKRLEEKKELRLKEIGAARSTLQQLRQELEEAETKLVYASAKAEEATKAAAEAKAATEAKAAGEAKAAASQEE
jgi:hypothetical protein